MRNTQSQETRRWDHFFAANRNLMNVGWRLDAFQFRLARGYNMMDGQANVDVKLRVGQADAGSEEHKTLLSTRWTGACKEYGGMNGNIVFRNDGSAYWQADSGALSLLGVDALNNINIRTVGHDDGSKSGGMQLGYTAVHGDVSHDFTSTVGNRVARFEKFVSYRHDANNTFAVGSQGQLMNMMTGLQLQMGWLYNNGGANIGILQRMGNSGSGLAHQGGKLMVTYQNAAGNEAGSEFEFDKATKKMTCNFATRLNLTDHTLAMKVNNSGVAQFLFGWRQNGNINAQFGTRLDIVDVARGRTRLPLCFQFDLNY